MVDQESGALAFQSKAPVGTPKDVVAHPGGVWVYAVDTANNQVCTFEIAQNTGALVPTTSPTTAAGRQPRTLAIHPSGSHLYVANYADSTISVYAIDAGSGMPVEIQSVPVPRSGQPKAVAMHPAGTCLYVASDGSSEIVVFSIAPDGTMSSVNAAVQAATIGQLTIDPSGQFFFWSLNLSDQLMCAPVDGMTGVPNYAQRFGVSMIPPRDYLRVALHPLLTQRLYVTFGLDFIAHLTFDRTNRTLTFGRLLQVPGASRLGPLIVHRSGAFAHVIDFQAGKAFTLACDTANGDLSVVGDVSTDNPQAITPSV